MPKLQDKAICNIELVEIITAGGSSKKYYFDTANEATYSPDISGRRKFSGCLVVDTDCVI